jgi:hypothetical protein
LDEDAMSGVAALTVSVEVRGADDCCDGPLLSEHAMVLTTSVLPEAGSAMAVVVFVVPPAVLPSVSGHTGVPLLRQAVVGVPEAGQAAVGAGSRIPVLAPAQSVGLAPVL